MTKSKAGLALQLCVALLLTACGGVEPSQQTQHIFSGDDPFTPLLPKDPNPIAPPDDPDNGDPMDDPDNGGPMVAPTGPGGGDTPPLEAPPTPFCGDGQCNSGEHCMNCWTDCGRCCGNGVCNSNEDYLTCPQDCQTCGNGVVDPGEDCDGSTPTGKTCSQMATYLAPYCGSGPVTCKNCRYDVSQCGMWWVHLGACVTCPPPWSHCVNPDNGLRGCRTPEGECWAKHF